MQKSVHCSDKLHCVFIPQELPEFWAYQELFATFVRKLSFCHVADLIPLLEVPGVKIVSF